MNRLEEALKLVMNLKDRDSVVELLSRQESNDGRFEIVIQGFHKKESPEQINDEAN